MQNFLTRIFGSRNDRLLRQYRKTVTQINALEAGIAALSDEQLQAKTPEFKAKIAAGATLESILPEAFAVCREAGKRVLGMRHFDVQLIGGMVLNEGKIAEMGTGEGKTLTATLAVYLNALSGKGVHLVTVNDYLVSRDAQWMGRIYRFLGLSVGINLSQMAHDDKKAAYACDITYSTNNECGFDYLRDNMVQDVDQKVQRGLNFAIVDEVDSILIDEARTPLIISGQAEDHTELYVKVNALPPMLKEMASEPKANEPEPPGDYWVDRKAQQVYLSEAGHEHAENLLTDLGMLSEGASLYDAGNILLLHHVMVALRAHVLFFKDQHYVVQGGEVIIVDEFTGRLMTGRRWSDGLHQAVEAKERVQINPENQTLASITFQNYFRMYKTLSGMTGTADTEAYEFQEIYGLETVVMPTHKPRVRIDKQDQIFRTADEKHRAIVAEIKQSYEKGQPVLVGTTSIENSEMLSELLTQQQLPHEVLNAKQHAREAEIVAEAGRPKAITIATNMAGRGTDIVLGGNISKILESVEEDSSISATDKAAKTATLRAGWQSIHEQVLKSGGLHIVGTERHESRRIDNQLRGRSGRQGDAGSSRFFLSLDDPLLKIFAGDKLKSIMNRLKLPDGEAIESGLVSRSIESAQRKVEARNFDIRKQLLEYDDVANDQRKVVYSQRNTILESASLTDATTELRHGTFEALFREHIPAESIDEQWDVPGLEAQLLKQWQLEVPLTQMLKDKPTLSDTAMLKSVIDAADAMLAVKVENVGAENWTRFERAVMLQSIDQAWREHLAALDHLRQGIHLRGFAQKNPKQEYKREAFQLFERMNVTVRDDITKLLLLVKIQSTEEVEAMEQAAVQANSYSNVAYTKAEFDQSAQALAADPEQVALDAQQAPEAQTANTPPPAQQPFQRFGTKIGRNDPCPCGSGKKYKACHGALS